MLYNLQDDLYLKVWAVWARPISVTPTVSQPAAGAYGGRGYYDQKALDVLAESGAIISDGETYLDILESEFPVLPMQGDQIDIPFHQGVRGGTFMVLDLTPGNAGGMITITLRKIVTNKPATP
jgi:hypothetical protein